MPRLARASVTLAKAARVLLAADVQAVTATELWAAIEQVASRDKVASAIEAVEELAPFGEDDDDDADRRAELVKRYATVRPFLPMLTAVVPFGSTDAGAPVLAAARSLPDLAGRKRVRASEVDGALVAGSWRRLVSRILTFLPGQSITGPMRCASWSSSTGHCATATCSRSGRCGGATRGPGCCTARNGSPSGRGTDRAAAREPASIHLAGLGRTLDVAWRGLATRLAESGQADGTPQVRLKPTPTARSGSGSPRWRRSPSLRRWWRCGT